MFFLMVVGEEILLDFYILFLVLVRLLFEGVTRIVGALAWAAERYENYKK
jgi:hypothetical protein